MVEATREQAEDHPSEVSNAELDSPLGIDDENLDANHDEDATLHFHNIINLATPHGLQHVV
jgi:hypothetical protein